MYHKKIIYYSDELNDDFAATKSIKKKIIDEKYNYFRQKNKLYKLWADTLYFIIVVPITKLIMLFVYHTFIHGRNKIKPRRKKGCLIYGNHTNYMPDAFIPNHLNWRRNYIITGSETVNIKGIAVLVDSLGAIPLPDTLKAAKNFKNCIEQKITYGDTVTIYPEAHIWPYYTGVRHFKKESIKYAIELNCAAYTLTTCYKKRKFGKKPRISAYVDGPFYPDESLPKKERVDKLYDEIYGTMKKRCDEESTYEYYKYVKKEDGINASSN